MQGYTEVHFVGNSEDDQGLYSYSAIGSLPQLIEGARVKSMQVPMLKYKSWSVLFKQDGEIIASRAVKNGEII